MLIMLRKLFLIFYRKNKLINIIFLIINKLLTHENIMVKKCSITKKKPLSGNNVSHAVNKSKRRFLPNLQNTSFYSEILDKSIKLKVTSKGIKTVEKNGGIDNYLLGLKNSKLNCETRKLKKILENKKS